MTVSARKTEENERMSGQVICREEASMRPTVMLVFSQICFKRKKPTKPHKKSESTH